MPTLKERRATLLDQAQTIINSAKADGDRPLADDERWVSSTGRSTVRPSMQAAPRRGESRSSRSPAWPLAPPGLSVNQVVFRAELRCALDALRPVGVVKITIGP
ncbi:hypothetical protein ACPPVQ_13645 [Diaminobutyricibacter sp. McL0618]|uniref:hypothetical protein n=1 Tax=Leifsonia sp. McL0618 TaxID=3415677 RepID=UPI003CF3E4CE